MATQVRLSPEEANAINLLGQQAAQLQAQLEAVRASQRAVLALLETKYNAVFNLVTGQLEPKVDTKAKEK